MGTAARRHRGTDRGRNAPQAPGSRGTAACLRYPPARSPQSRGPAGDRGRSRARRSRSAGDLRLPLAGDRTLDHPHLEPLGDHPLGLLDAHLVRQREQRPDRGLVRRSRGGVTPATARSWDHPAASGASTGRPLWGRLHDTALVERELQIVPVDTRWRRSPTASRGTQCTWHRDRATLPPNQVAVTAVVLDADEIGRRSRGSGVTRPRRSRGGSRSRSGAPRRTRGADRR